MLAGIGHFKPTGLSGRGFTRQAGIGTAPPAQIRSRERIGMTESFRCSVKDDLPAFFTGSRSHIDDAVGGEHYLRIGFDNEGVAGIAKTPQDSVDAVHVARM